MLNTILTDPEDGYLYLRIDGELTRADYDGFKPAFEQLLEARQQPLPVMVEFSDDFQDWDGVRALMQEAPFLYQQRERIGRVAVVGDSRLRQWADRAGDVAGGMRIKFFEHATRANAGQWLRGEPMTELPR